MAPVLLRDEATGQREKIAETWYLTSTPAAQFIHRTFLRTLCYGYVRRARERKTFDLRKRYRRDTREPTL
jgi:hypothetical protein